METKKPTWDTKCPSGAEIFIASADNEFMLEAKRVRDTLSTDLSFSTGAVVVKDGVILGFGANQAGFSKLPIFAEFFMDKHTKGMCVRKFLKVPSGQGYWMCPGCSTHHDHAESCAIRDAIKKHGKDAVKGATVYLYGHYWCCAPCWKAMLDAGVTTVYVVDNAYDLFARKK